eukprot:CAMPEP_0181176420 /NCGR_PEP_ID=MMETSP1096-20121128/4621_1 /TAXON_ID=156174 ORGANISM="Chrysochromulina ericina, Strain CCMP281" /NCGR_SAMPLE_ID=MMETSP1096 /ASSEMBLY_ACC=CAM_ASM_000453 /LENGTH=92 /DNA_ID=CAMNT_0023264509 /DNA_START=373 /DNA_END=647 /DNA_ORIENTATION=-
MTTSRQKATCSRMIALTVAESSGHANAAEGADKSGSANAVAPGVSSTAAPCLGSPTGQMANSLKDGIVPSPAACRSVVKAAASAASPWSPSG